MDRNLMLLNQNIARLRRDVRLQTWEIEQLIAARVDDIRPLLHPLDHQHSVRRLLSSVRLLRLLHHHKASSFRRVLDILLLRVVPSQISEIIVRYSSNGM
jgi:hypothetical protein